MSLRIGDGGGKNGDMRTSVDQRGLVQSVMRTESQEANAKGQGVNINTDDVTISAETVLLYVKNTRSTKISGEDQIFRVTNLAVQFRNGSSPVFAGRGKFSVDFDGDGGTVISSNNVVPIKSNQNPGSTETFVDLTALVGASGETVTNVSQQGHFDIDGAEGARVMGDFDWVLPQGKAISVKIDPNLSSGTLDVYVNLAGYYTTLGL